MEYCITVSRTLIRAYTIEAASDEAAEVVADALMKALKSGVIPAVEMESGEESWDYAMDQDGRDVVTWSE